MNAAVSPTRKTLLKKITPKTISEAVHTPYNLLEMPRPDGYVEDKVLYDLFGTINRVRQGQTDKGPWVQFKGRFQAVTPDGEVFDSGAVHLPGGVEDLVFAALDEARVKSGGAPVTLEIAFRVAIKRAKPGKPSATGYEYDVQPLIAQTLSPDDPIARLRSEVAKQNAPQLEGPKSVPENVAEVAAPAAAMGKAVSRK